MGGVDEGRFAAPFAGGVFGSIIDSRIQWQALICRVDAMVRQVTQTRRNELRVTPTVNNAD